MQHAPKEWLVRTRAGEVLGPYTQRELLDELKKNLFSIEDEIAPSQGHWISAEALTYHEADELTSTSTRTHQSITSDLQDGPLEETPPPETSLHNRTTQLGRGKIRIPAHLIPKQKTSSLNPLFLGILLAGMVFSALAYLKVRRGSTVNAPEPVATLSTEGESAFVRQIYALIHAGKSSAALRALTLYHERGPAKNDVEYLVPYAALLILEGESPNRAKKFLDQVLDSDAPAFLKSRAHLWLGYLALSSDKLDQAEGNFLEALQLSPKDPAARFNLGRTYLKQEKYALALDYLQLAELEARDLWLIHIYKGRAKFALDQRNEAESSFRVSNRNGSAQLNLTLK
jgi:tetratricopeptide (TPR) repeat protein